MSALKPINFRLLRVFFSNTPLDQGSGYHPSLDFRYKAPDSYTILVLNGTKAVI